MPKFTDSITINIKAGDGGQGAVSFHREKYVPKGGPDGGDGGKGGNVYVIADRRYYNLSHFFKNKPYHAKRGGQGMSQNRHGADGEDLIIHVPPGTQVIDVETGDLLADLIQEDVPVMIAEGGIGGKGNAFFKSSTHQAPMMAQEGLPGIELDITLNLKLIADIGLVGLPNAGKSSLLSILTNAKPKIADYPFTTLIPNLGMLNTQKATYSIADIPGIIEGAHKGHGLGLSFLQHIERVKVILFLIDITGDDLLYTFELLRSELANYNETLLTRPFIVVFTKIDLIDESEMDERIKGFDKMNYICISSINEMNIGKLKKNIDSLMSVEDESESA
jgi:GTP-binding protein